MNDDGTGRPGYLDRHLTTLERAYTLRAMPATGDAGRLAELKDHYLRDAMVLLSTAYGRECADQVRLSRPQPRAVPRSRVHPWLRRAGDSIVRHTLEWHHQVLGSAGASER